MEGTVGIARASTITYQTHRSNRKLPKKFYFATCKPTVPVLLVYVLVRDVLVENTDRYM